VAGSLHKDLLHTVKKKDRSKNPQTADRAGGQNKMFKKEKRRRRTLKITKMPKTNCLGKGPPQNEPGGFTEGTEEEKGPKTG